jgi:predicted HTH transcriptional regulator
MNVVEAWGSGIPKMFREAKEYGLREPELIDMGSDFRVNLYRKTVAVDQNGVIDSKNLAQSGTAEMPDQEQTIVMYVRENGTCTTAKVGELLEVKDRRTRQF